LATRTRIVVVRHASEVSRTSNTGHLAVAALSNALLVDYGLPGRPLDLRPVLGDRARVLWPGGGTDVEPPDTLVVLDGSWSQVRTMRARIPPLMGLPSLDLPAPTEAPRRIRTAPTAGAMATMEAVAAALVLLGEREQGEALGRFFSLVVARQRRMRGEV
jgi:DTW domain-containing protein YfiP